MKVLVLQSELGVLRGGGENFTKNLFAAFAERGHYVAAAFFADLRSRYPIPLPTAIEPIPIRALASANLGQPMLASIGRCIANEDIRRKWDHIQEAVSWRTIRWHRNRFRRKIESRFADRWKEFDAVYVHSNIMLARQVAQYRPAVLRLPGPVTAEEEPFLRQVHAVCANGDALVQIQRFLGDHVIDLPVGVDSGIFKPGSKSVRSDLGWSGEHVVIGYVGRLLHLKGVDLLARAFKQISTAVPNARLLIIGSGPEENYIRPTLATEIARGTVHLESDVNHLELPQWYGAMDLFVMPSRYENFSNAVIEAMACGIPFLAADVGGNKILAANGGGWLFETESISSLSASLHKIITDCVEIRRRGIIACSYVQKQNSWSATAQRLEYIISSRLGVHR